MKRRRGVLIFSAFTLVCLAYAWHRAHRPTPAAMFAGAARVEHLLGVAMASHEAAHWKELGSACAETHRYDKAASAYRQAADILWRKGEPSQAYETEKLGHHFETDAQMFFSRKPEPQSVKRFYSGARLEPIYGCYTGAFIDHEDSIHGTYRDEYGVWRRDASAFNHLVGSKQAIFFIYSGYGRKFPAKFVRHMNDNGAAAHIAFEPDSLALVKDDAYLHDWARQAKESKTPIFLRFASEMNGDWTPYHGDPELYKQKFRLVAKVMHAEAPNVAMVWCPFEIPIRFIQPYYPGPEAVDWVGVNIYSVPYNNNNPKHDASWVNPADQLRYMYNLYASRHPIMICEYAASHRSSFDMLQRTDWARGKIGELYACLPRLYPRVKAVNWLSMNAIKHAMPGRQLNDYALLDDDQVRKRYEQMLYSGYYLQSVSRKAPAIATEEIVPLKDGQVLSGKVGLSAWVKTYEDNPNVSWLVNGQELRRDNIPGAYHWTLDTSSVAPGAGNIELLVTDSAGVTVKDVVQHVLFVNTTRR